MKTLSRRLLLAAAPAVLLAACDKLPGAGGGAGAAAKPSFHGIDITGADYAKKLDLPDVDGKVRALADFKGKVTVVFFGYTQCPDVCPTTMAELATIRRQLGADGDKLQAVFVTVDPERDTPELLKQYMAGFDPSFVALRGTPEQTQAVAKEFKVFYAKVPGKDQRYTMDHTAGSYVFDTAGRIRLFVRYGTPTEQLAADLKTLIAAGA